MWALPEVPRERHQVVNIMKLNKDEWSGFADLLANLIEKYVDDLDIENLPEPQEILEKKDQKELT